MVFDNCGGAAAYLFALSSLVFVAGVVGASALLAALRPALHEQGVPTELIVCCGVESGLAASLLVVAIQTWVRVRWRSVAGALGLDIVAVLGLLGGVAWLARRDA